jgi:predicted PurR-regulated permease PerM
LKNPSLFNFLSTENFNTTISQTGKSLTLAGMITLYTFLLIYYKDFFAEFILRLYAASDVRVLTWTKDAGRVIQSYFSGILKVTLVVSILP